jgi:hypothetical protein
MLQSIIALAFQWVAPDGSRLPHEHDFADDPAVDQGLHGVGRPL